MSQDPSQSSSPSTHYGPSPSSSLYLFTFLSTLVVLLAISSFVVMRSYVLRRRYQRRVSQALAAGIILTPRAQGSRQKRFRLRPKFHHVWVMPGQNEKWESIMPVSVHLLSSRKHRRCSNQPRPLEPPQRSWPSSLPAWAQSMIGSSDPASPQPPPNSGAHLRPDNPPKKLQVSVLVAMPSPRWSQNPSTLSLTNGKAKSSNGDTEDDELPDFVIGVTELPYTSKMKEKMKDEESIDAI